MKVFALVLPPSEGPKRFYQGKSDPRFADRVVCLLSDEETARKTIRNARCGGVSLELKAVELDPSEFWTPHGLMAVVKPIGAGQ